MVDCLTLCNLSCITCLWCLLLSLCFPSHFKREDDTDSNYCSFRPVCPKRINRCRCAERKRCRRQCSRISNLDCLRVKQQSCPYLKSDNNEKSSEKEKGRTR